MIKPNNITFPFSVIAHSETCLAIGVSDLFPYIDGKPVRDVPSGIRVEIVLTENNFEKITVKLEGTKHPLTPESFKVEGTTYRVKFSPDFQAKFYRTSTGDYALSCKASTVEIVK